MGPLPIVGIVGGVVATALVGLRLRAVSAKKDTSKLPPEQQAAIARPLPPSVTQSPALTTRGPELSENAQNALKIELAAGTLDLNSFLKGTNGALFVKKSEFSGGLADDALQSIIPTDTITVDVGTAGLLIPAIPSGNMLFVARTPVNMQTRSLEAVSADPRVPDTKTAIVIPAKAVTGIQPAEDR